MELRQLRYFVQVAQQLSFSAASKELCVTQSTLSQQVKQLELELGTQLLERDSHTVRLTEAGRELMPHALRTLHAAATCRDHLNDLQGMRTGTLDIGVTYSFSPMLTETIVAFSKKHPGIKLNVHYHDMESLMKALENRQIDFLLCFKPLKRCPDVVSRPLFSTCLAAIVGERHPLAERKSVTLQELSRYSLALPIQGMQARETFDRLSNRTELTFTVKAEVNMVHVLMGIVRNSMEATVLADAVVRHVPGIRCIPIDAPGNKMEGCVHTLKGAYEKASAHEFIHMLMEQNAVHEFVSEFER